MLGAPLGGVRWAETGVQIQPKLFVARVPAVIKRSVLTQNARCIRKARCTIPIIENLIVIPTKENNARIFREITFRKQVIEPALSNQRYARNRRLKKKRMSEPFI